MLIRFLITKKCYNIIVCLKKGRGDVKIKWLVQGLACSSVLFCSNMAAAADTLLAQVPLQLTAEQTVTAELWGDRLSNATPMICLL